MPHVTVIDNIRDLDQLQLVWRRLWQQTQGASFFQSLEWLRVYWRHFGTGQRLRVLIVEQDGEVLGIVPLVVRVESTRIGLVRLLTYPLHDWGTFFGPIGPNPTITLTACFQQIAAMRRDWDLLDLRWVNRQEIDHGRTPIALSTAGFSNRPGIWRTSAFIDFSESWPQYLQARSRKFRENLRRAESDAAKLGCLSFERYRPEASCHGGDSPRWDIFDDCLAIAQQSWQGHSTTGTTLSHANVQEFFRELFGVAAQFGALDINMLRLNGQLAAFAYNLQTDGRLCGLRLGYDPALADMSPGRLILARLVEDSHRRGDTQIDMGSESMSFKQSWLTRTLDSYRYTHYPLFSWRSQMLRLKHWLRPRTRENIPESEKSGGGPMRSSHIRPPPAHRVQARKL